MGDPELLDILDYDVILLGTGLTESILSGALSRAGKTVLHLDKNDYYGDLFGSIQGRQFFELLSPESQGSQDEHTSQANNSKVINVKPSIHYFDSVITPSKERLEEFYSCTREYRQFYFDTFPRLIWSFSDTVSTFIRGGIARSVEFKAVQHSFILLDGKFKQVPCSKGDIFTNKFLTVSDKRALMKFITTIVNPSESDREEFQQKQDTPFVEFLNAKKFSSNLKAFILYAIALIEADQNESNELVSLCDGLERIQRYFESLGRFGQHSPWIFPIFGSSDVLQAFCRLSAVYNGTFILNRNAQDILLDDDMKCKGIICTKGQELNCNYLVSSPTNLPEYTIDSDEFVSRAIVVTDKSFVSDESQDTLVLGIIPPNSIKNKYTIYLLQVDETASLTPKEKFMVHLWTRGHSSAQEDLKNAVNQFFTENMDDSTLPHNLLSFYFSRKVQKECTEKPANVFITPGINMSLDMDDYFKHAERMFQSMYPGEDFIAEVPNPEDIIWEYEEEGNPNDTENTELDDLEQPK